ncbi:TadE/TadG family type IV pilus assembly protein [Vallitalea okinawensis]|uniref:TadE/TadG family type IV pilus assembly protein n=1 Tax=Vallitalea okinawensis TaxID=2078660 RepID=UPI000CFDD3FC|nr:TadE/TadG family type IV pilus assembly protein [Vallitalea okinawensis]
MKIITPLKNEKGQSLVEFAIILPLVLIIILGIIEFGIMFNAYLTITSASREGARLGAVGGSDSEIESLISSITPQLNADKLVVTITPSEGARDRGDSITVTASYDYQVLIPLLGDIISNLVDLTAQTVMRVE